MNLFDHESALQNIPTDPGCYIMRNRAGKIVYIGKAKNLKNRVRSYFSQGGDNRHFVHVLPKVLGTIETIVTKNEKEAMILENTLIKAHKPRYNVRLKDDKNFLSLRVDLDHEWPRVEVVRRKKKDRAKYFGPYHNAKSIRRTLGLLNRHFQLRTCPDSVLVSRQRPCLQYQIKRCPAPCVFDLDREDYKENVSAALMFLEGRAEELTESIRTRMFEASEKLEYERAARLRDQVVSIQRSMEQQQAVSTNSIDRDVYGFHRVADHVTIELLYVRGGRLEGAHAFSFEDQEFPDEDVLSSFLNQYYASDHFIPTEVLIPFSLWDGEEKTLSEILTDRKTTKVTVAVPKRGAKRALLETAQANAKNSYDQSVDQQIQQNELLSKLQTRLHLKNFPARIECYDISNLQGTQIVGSQVVFEDGEAKKEDYRHFKMKEVTTQDDFASMRELLSRRFVKVADGEEPGPDLMVIDGGKGQLAQASAVLEDLGLHEIDLVSLAKSRVDKTGFDDSEVTRSPERVFIPGRKNPIVLRQNSAELYLLERVRDEAHRFAISFHKNLRRKATLRSQLDDIPGIGPKTRNDLLKHFGSVKKVKSATLKELVEVNGVGQKTADLVYNFFQAKE